MALQTGLLGIVLMVLSGLAVTAEMVFSKVMLHLAWPYWRTTALACLLTSALLAARLASLRAGLPDLQQAKWVVLQAIFGAGYWCLGIIAVQIGIDPGDVASLTSINIVVAAVMGRVFLAEAFRWLHGCAVVVSVVGAVLISQPDFLFAAGSGRAPGVGYAVVLAAGFFQGLFFVSARKAHSVQVHFLTLGVTMVSVPFCMLLPITPLVTESSASVMWASPLEAAGWVSVALITTIFSAGLQCAGSVLCPAAVSATVYTAASMVFGYMAQILLFGVVPAVVTLIGAALMLSAVALMAFADKARFAGGGGSQSDEAALGSGEGAAAKSGVVPTAGAGGPSPPAGAGDGGVGEEEDDSFMSFAASELSEFRPQEAPPVRLRRHLGQSGLQTQPRLASASSVASAAVLGAASA